MSYHQKYVFQKKQKNINVKAFNMITNKSEAKTMTKHISCDCKFNFNSATCNSTQKWNNKTCQSECKNYHTCKKDSWNPSTCICENYQYLKSIGNISVIDCNEIIPVMIKRHYVDKSMFFMYLVIRFMYYIFTVHIFKPYSPLTKFLSTNVLIQF